MVPVEFARLGHAQSGQNAFIPAEDRTVRQIGQACHSKRSCPHRVCEIFVRRSFRGDSGLATMGMDIDRNRFALLQLWECDGRIGCVPSSGLAGRCQRAFVCPRKGSS